MAKLKTKKVNDISYDPDLFDAWQTGTPLDKIISVRGKGGVPKATNFMVVGDPGAGKSTVCMEVLAKAKEHSARKKGKRKARVLFISAEMNEVDLYLYVERFPQFGDLDTIFPGDLTMRDDYRPGNGDIQRAIEEKLDGGYDLVLIDSFVELRDSVKEDSRITGTRADNWLLGLINRHNISERHTSFLCIQQVNKGGVFVGSNRLKHMTTGMMEIRFVDERTQEERYIVFSKNRRGMVGKKLYFDLESGGEVKFDEERFKKSEKLKELKKLQKERMKESGKAFDKLFNIGDQSSEEEIQKAIDEIKDEE